jgi:hypothetical protein
MRPVKTPSWRALSVRRAIPGCHRPGLSTQLVAGYACGSRFNQRQCRPNSATAKTAIRSVHHQGLTQLQARAQQSVAHRGVVHAPQRFIVGHIPRLGRLGTAVRRVEDVHLGAIARRQTPLWEARKRSRVEGIARLNQRTRHRGHGDEQSDRLLMTIGQRHEVGSFFQFRRRQAIEEERGIGHRSRTRRRLHGAASPAGPRPEKVPNTNPGGFACASRRVNSSIADATVNELAHNTTEPASHQILMVPSSAPPFINGQTRNQSHVQEPKYQSAVAMS